MPNLFRFDSTKKFNRGQQLAHVRIDGTPSRSGSLGEVNIYPFIYTGDRKKLSATDMGGPFLYSQKFHTQECEWWETTIVADSPEDVGGVRESVEEPSMGHDGSVARPPIRPNGW